MEPHNIYDVTTKQSEGMRNNNVAGQPGFINSMALNKVLPCAKSLEIFSEPPPQFLLPAHQGTDKPPSNSSNLGVMVQRSDQGLRVNVRQIRLHCITPGNFLSLGVPVFTSVKWVEASNNCLIDGLKVVIHTGLTLCKSLTVSHCSFSNHLANSSHSPFLSQLFYLLPSHLNFDYPLRC